MLKEALLVEIIIGPPQGPVEGQKMSVEGSSNRCKMDTRPDWTLMRDLHRGNRLCHISSSSPNVEINYESWRIYESKSMI